MIIEATGNSAAAAAAALNVLLVRKGLAPFPTKGLGRTTGRTWVARLVAGERKLYRH